MAGKSLIPTDTIKVLAEEVNVRIADDMAVHLASDVEYRLREITQVRAKRDAAEHRSAFTQLFTSCRKRSSSCATQNETH